MPRLPGVVPATTPLIPALPHSFEELQKLSGREVNNIRKRYGPTAMAHAIGTTAGEVSKDDASRQQMAALDPLISASATKYDIPKSWINAVIQKESGGRTKAISPTGALGPMQLTHYVYLKNGPFHEEVNPFEPASAIDRGAHLLKLLGNKYHGDIEKVAAAYHDGEAKVDALIEQNGSAWRVGLDAKLLRDYVQPIAAQVAESDHAVAAGQSIPRHLGGERM